MNFYEAYNKYVADKLKGIDAVKPVDPSGYFDIDEMGRVNLAYKYRHPQIPQDETNKSGNLPKVTQEFANKQGQTNGILPHGGERDAVSAYTFSQSTTTFTTIVGGTGTVAITSALCDDTGWGPFPVGFTFTLDATAFTTFTAQCNGYIEMGSTIPGGYGPICSALINIIDPFSGDLEGNPTNGGVMYYQLSGSSPNRVLTVEWHNWGFFSSALNEINLQIKLFETSNVIQFIYQPTTPTSSYSMQVGLTGAVGTDFINRTSTTSWSATTAGAAACSYVTESSAIFPSNGLTFTWTPPVASPMTYVSSNTIQYQNGDPVFAISSGAANQIINQIQVVTSGSLSPFTVTSFSLGTNGSTNPPTDITNAKVYYTGTSNVFATTTLVGTTASPNGTFTLTGSQALQSG